MRSDLRFSAAASPRVARLGSTRKQQARRPVVSQVDTSGDSARWRVPGFASAYNRTPVVGSLTRATYAIVLAGGRGSRLQQLTSWRAKPAVPFGGKHRIIDFALSNCINSGVRRIGVATQYRSYSLIQHLQRGWNFLDAHLREFLDVLPAQQPLQTGWYGGTADAVFQSLDILRAHSPRYVIVLAGDHVYKMDYGVMLAEHVARDAQVSIACLSVPLEDAHSLGVMRVNESGEVLEFSEKPARPAPLPGKPDRALASMGIYVFTAEALYEFLRADAHDPDSSHDFGRDVIPRLLRDGATVYTHRFSDSCVNMVEDRPYWRDVGTVDAYWAANLDLTRVQPELNMYDPEWPIRTLEEHLPPAKFIFESPDPRGQAWDCLVSSGCIVTGASIHRTLLFTGAMVERGSHLEDSVILPEVTIGRKVRLRRAIVDKFCELPNGFTAGFDRTADEARFYVSPGGVVLITPEMLGQRVHEPG
jgi:glucose-1-phosphate adenylyltransferase